MRRSFAPLQENGEKQTTTASAWVKLAAFAAIEVVDEEADDEPDEEALPCADGEAGHQEQAESDAEDGDDRAEGDAKAAVAGGVFVTQHDDANGNQHEGEKGADV